jgi:hypothetical protein
MRRAVIASVMLVAVAAFAWNLRQVPQKPDSQRWEDTAPRGAGDLPPQAGISPRATAPSAAKIEAFCSSCHMLPPADDEPKSLWPAKIKEMYWYATGARPQPADRIPPRADAVDYWTSRAPTYLAMPAGSMGSPPPPRPFERRLLRLDAIADPPSVANVRFVRLTDEAVPQILICDMRHGLVVLWTPSRSLDSAGIIGQLRHPCRAHVLDLDGDGLRDVLVSDLGDYWPVDTDQGAVVWLRNRGAGRFEPVTLAGGLGRVADAQAADFDGDGDLDIVVGVFGNLTTGMVLYLENCTQDYDHPDFEAVPLDYRTGTSDVPIVDLNGDGRPDFLALQAQEHDHILAFINRGGGNFRTELLYKAPHHRWGSTGIGLFDVDGDGDLDVLYNHGDSVQLPPIPRPYHGFGWIENRGNMPFAYHRLAHLPGAHTSLPADLDGDGLVDFVSSAFIPAFNPDWPDAQQLDSVIWLRQIAPGQFQRFALESRTPFHPCGDLGDYDGDGRVDIVLGNFVMFPGDNNRMEGACLTLFRLAP